jgi:hypothetical protein
MWSWCCDALRERVEQRCDEHPDPFDCPDKLVSFSPKFQEFGLIVHDGGSSSIGIDYCPWCGAGLPASARDRWFDELERRGLQDPDDAPADMQTEAWLRGGRT